MTADPGQDAQAPGAVALPRRDRAAAQTPRPGPAKSTCEPAAGVDAESGVVIEGAIFTVGVALFDTVVDDGRRRLGEAAVALSPARIRQHVVAGIPLPPPHDAGVELVVALFRSLFERMRQRM